MSLFRRNKRAQAVGDEAPDPAVADAPDAPTEVQPDAATAEPVASQRDPAELDALVGEAPSSRRRGRLRRRLRHLRRVREVLLRDLGGLTFELHRRGAGEGGPVLEGKLARLGQVDREIRELEAFLDDHRAMIVREPGIGGTCAECGEIFGSEARYCWACGNPVAIGAAGAPHLAAWTTHPALTSGSPEPTQLQTPWVEHEHADQSTAPLPQMDPEVAAAETPAANEPATGDVGGTEGAVWSDATVVEEPPPPPPEQWLPQQDEGAPRS